MSILAWSHRTRILLLGLLVVLLAAATVVVGGRQSAQAFDCNAGGARPLSCPFIRVSQGVDTRYTATADLVDSGGKVLYHWYESDKNFTLWRWRWFGGGERINLTISIRDAPSSTKIVSFPASESHCYVVNRVEVKEDTTHCKAG